MSVAQRHAVYTNLCNIRQQGCIQNWVTLAYTSEASGCSCEHAAKLKVAAVIVQLQHISSFLALSLQQPYMIPMADKSVKQRMMRVSQQTVAMLMQQDCSRTTAEILTTS